MITNSKEFSESDLQNISSHASSILSSPQVHEHTTHSLKSPSTPSLMESSLSPSLQSEELLFSNLNLESNNLLTHSNRSKLKSKNTVAQ